MSRPLADVVPRPLDSPRAAAIAGVLFAVLFGTSMVLVRVALPDEVHPEAGWLDEHATMLLRIGIAIVPFAGITFLWFIGVVRDRFKETEDQLFVSVILGSGLLFLAMIFVFAAIAGAMVATIPLVADPKAGSDVLNFGHALMLQVSNIYALRMAGVLLISLSTMWLRTGVMPRWFAFLTYIVAAVLLFTTSLGLWVTLLFPLWVLAVSIIILVTNYRREPS
ncbi:MAG: hypothetical protein ABWY57_17345 [Mycetocola sp.]